MAYKDDDAMEYPCTGPARLELVREHLAVDIIRSRYAALYHVPEPGIPVFTALDDVHPIHWREELPDLVYIDKAAAPTGIEELIQLLPFHGRAWYPRPAVEYLLHTNKVVWSDLTHGVRATGHIPGDQLRAAFDTMDAAWADVVRAGEAADRICVGTCRCGGPCTKPAMCSRTNSRRAGPVQGCSIASSSLYAMHGGLGDNT
jgi:hypothetical protein